MSAEAISTTPELSLRLGGFENKKGSDRCRKNAC
jgi:hypothetical protein